MKIFFFIHDFRAGGAERVAATLLNELSKRGHTVMAVTYTDSPDHYVLDASIIRKRIDFRGHDRQEFAKMHRFLRAIVFFRRFPMIRSSIKGFRPDVVLSFQTKANIYCAIACIGLGIPVLVSEHSYRWAKSISRRTDSLRVLAYIAVARIIVLTEEDKKNYRFSKKIKVIANPNPFSGCPDTRPSKKKEILAVGRLVSIKGFDLLISAISIVGKERLRGYKVIIVGEGQERRALEQATEQLGLKDIVTFVGQSLEMVQYYKDADIFVLSSRFEGLPMALIEAMSFGCTPIAFDCPVGPRAIITSGIDGILVPEEDTCSLAEAIGRLIGSDEERQKIGEAALVSSKRFDLSSIVDTWEAVFREVVNK